MVLTQNVFTEPYQATRPPDRQLRVEFGTDKRSNFDLKTRLQTRNCKHAKQRDETVKKKEGKNYDTTSRRTTVKNVLGGNSQNAA